ncbi:MAG TPA: hypothetical protein VGC04_05655, partial [Cellulomonas sp.]
MTTSEASATPTWGGTLRRLYLTRFVFALVWAAVLLVTTPSTGPLLTVLLVVYPLVDAAAVLWQLRAERGPQRSSVAERVNVAVSVLVAIALGWASTVSIAAALTVWGVWAVGSGVPQLITALHNRRTG